MANGCVDIGLVGRASNSYFLAHKCCQKNRGACVDNQIWLDNHRKAESKLTRKRCADIMVVSSYDHDKASRKSEVIVKSYEFSKLQ